MIDHVPCDRWENFSVIAGLRTKGIVAPMLVPGAMNTESLRAWAIKCLCPNLHREDIVIWDNLGIHNDQIVGCAIAERGAWLEFLPPYSPDFNPIELAWSKMKTTLRTLGPRTWNRLVRGVGHALLAITSSDARAWFGHCGYTVK